MSRSEAILGNGTKSAEIRAQYKKFIGRKILFIFSSLILIVIITGISEKLGSYPITATEEFSILWQGLFQNPETTKELVVWSLRLPPILTGILACIGLAIAGTTMQAGGCKEPIGKSLHLRDSFCGGIWRCSCHPSF
jgi:ABC-type enterobactin transport system permease subunit